MKVIRAFRIVDNDLVADESIPAKYGFAPRDVIGPITSIRHVEGARCVWKRATGFHAYVRTAVLAANLLLLARVRLP